jgi:hypothetical protein
VCLWLSKFFGDEGEELEEERELNVRGNGIFQEKPDMEEL